MKILPLIISILMLLSFDAAALDVKQRFDHLDSDKSGYLTHDELDPQPQLLNTFVKWDKNQDNQISLIEFKNYLTDNLY
ncbi:EF-hand domain-containing protein [Pseudoalteromonas sp. SR43-6]|uniref:EF-hand domain-containing protein n=1 Tax=unclassified Pseudoalteromonas TaxID=194690 RepID=UPI0015FBD83C|nr:MULTISPECIES: EF-hand domain-containing protein [unclassified Pseudoalteromonas]MBB1288667.1 EF-hand domain-containing protein [Pseudoalteromonas sp. SR41-5]MBB1374077.1 EF-hand domain-containing protein [Pseudoalteromonas sp. SR43-6]MBB1413128.1 EF-hand domain-containing protein [Pseudoalteromonas sp. SG43-8]